MYNVYMDSIKQILHYTRGMKWLFIIITASSIIGSLLMFVQPYVIKIATDWVSEILMGKVEFSFAMIVILGAIVAVNAIVQSIVGDIGGYAGDQMAIKIRYQLSTMYYNHLLQLPQKYYDDETTGKIINRLSRAITEITRFMQFFSNNLFQLLISLVLVIGILAFYSWQVALLFALLIPVGLYLTARTSGPWQKLESAKNHHFDVASSRFAEVIGQMRLVKSFRTEKSELKYFDSEMHKMIPLNAKQSKHWHTMNALRTGAFGLITGAILALLFHDAAKGQITIGDMAMLITLVAQVSFPIRNLSMFVDQYQRAVANSTDFIKAMNEQPEPSDSGKVELEIKSGKIEYKNVDFAYGKGKNVLHEISFSIKPDTKLALVGESGGGKTTISNLLMGLYEPTSGEVLIDGQNILESTRGSVRRNIATVFQDAALFSGTIRENIAYAKPNATPDEIDAAARAANAYDFINKFEKGYDTEIGERGIKLSGGQKQRLSIARAILKDAPILILDEATSSLDSRAEHEVQEALDRLMKKRTTLIIAHRLSTIAGVDTIVTLKDGKVDEIGTPHELAKTDGIYSQLLKLQMGDTESAKKKLAKFDIAA